jgi:hypothetical protein
MSTKSDLSDSEFLLSRKYHKISYASYISCKHSHMGQSGRIDFGSLNINIAGVCITSGFKTSIVIVVDFG